MLQQTHNTKITALTDRPFTEKCCIREVRRVLGSNNRPGKTQKIYKGRCPVCSRDIGLMYTPPFKKCCVRKIKDVWLQYGGPTKIKTMYSGTCPTCDRQMGLIYMTKKEAHEFCEKHGVDPNWR